MFIRSPLWLLIGWLGLGACGSKSEPVEHYATRGVITAVTRDPDETVVTLHHEAVPSFKDRDGKPSAMGSMKMNFSLGQQPATDLAVGDKLSIDFEVHWNGGPPLRITRRQKLPSETPLTLSDGE
jgi:hypothetical protein